MTESTPETLTEVMNHWLMRVAYEGHTICVLSGRHGGPDVLTLLRNGEELDRMTIPQKHRAGQLVTIAERAMQLQPGWIVCSTTKGWLSYNLEFKRKVFSSAPNQAEPLEEAAE